MGSINRFDLARMKKDFNTHFFFETGTFKGDGVAYASDQAFDKIISVEIIPELASDAAKRFREDPRVSIITSDSISALQQQLMGLKGNGIFWLDAHFPGADAGLADYDKSGDERTRLPLPAEIAMIKRQRPAAMDVLVIDDLRIYEDGAFERGNVPPDALPQGERSIDFVEHHFGDSHYLVRSYCDEGYLLVFPKKTYRRKHFKMANLFGRPIDTSDHYYSL